MRARARVRVRQGEGERWQLQGTALHRACMGMLRGCAQATGTDSEEARERYMRYEAWEEWGRNLCYHESMGA